MTGFTKTILQFIRANALIPEGATVVIGVSGGADSTALLYTLNSLRHELGIQLHVAHINHQLRKTAITDERFVKKLADSLGLPFHTQRVTVRRTAQKSSLEDAAREARQKALFQIAGHLKAHTIALAHTQDDLAETVLMRIIRGTGLEGLQGISSRRDFGGYTIVRPFLSTSRKDIEQFLTQHKLKYRTDPTNKQILFFRNKIRLKLLPLLEKDFNPGIKKTLANLAQTAAFDYTTLDSLAQKHYRKIVGRTGKSTRTLSLSKLKNIPVSLQRLIFRHILKELKNDPLSFSLQHIREIEDLIQSRPDAAVVNLPLGIAVKKESNQLIFAARKA